MFEAVGVPELFKCGDVRPFIFDWEALEGRESDAGWGEVQVLEVGIKFWLHFETLLEGDIDGLGLVQVGSYYLYLRALYQLNGVRSNQRQEGGQGCYDQAKTYAHCGLVNIIKRQKLLF